MRELMETFNTFKRRFHKEHRDIRMDLPNPLHNLNINNKVEEGEITITKFVTAYLFLSFFVYFILY